MTKTKSHAGRAMEGSLYVLEGLFGFGLLSGAAVVAALGNFVLGGVLGVFALGVFARFKRGRRAKTVLPPQSE